MYGHNALRGLQLRDTSVGLDTGCCYGGRLSAYVLPDQRVVSVPARRMYSKPTKVVPGAVDGEGAAVSRGVCLHGGGPPTHDMLLLFCLAIGFYPAQ